MRLASRVLKDDAARWFAVYKNLNMTWAEFCELLRSRYASSTTLMRLSAKLYGQAQKEKEGMALFLEQRHLLARRLFPDAPEQHIIGILIEALRASTKKLIRSSTFETVGELVIWARQIEQDELDERSASRRNAQNPANPDNLHNRAVGTASGVQTSAAKQTPAAKNSATSLPPCPFCPGRHWNRDCPQNLRRPGNHSGAPTTAAFAAPD